MRTATNSRIFITQSPKMTGAGSCACTVATPMSVIFIPFAISLPRNLAVLGSRAGREHRSVAKGGQPIDLRMGQTIDTAAAVAYGLGNKAWSSAASEFYFWPRGGNVAGRFFLPATLKEFVCA